MFLLIASAYQPVLVDDIHAKQISFCTLAMGALNYICATLGQRTVSQALVQILSLKSDPFGNAKDSTGRRSCDIDSP